MNGSRRPSAQTIAVVLALAEQPATWRYGHELCQQLDLEPGRLYRALMRLADRGLLETTWEAPAPAGRPPRHLYQLTGLGRALAAELAAAPAAPAKAARGPGTAGRRPRLEGT